MARIGLADIHIHTSFSDGWPAPAEVVDHVTLETPLDVIAITDHDTIEGALRARDHSQATGGVAVIIGEEVSSRDGHVLGLFLERRVAPGQCAAATVEAIHAQGGLAIAAHPFWRTARIARRLKGPVHGVGWLAAELEFDAIETENSAPAMMLANRIAGGLATAAGKAATGGSDAHILEAIGKATTAFPGRTPRALRAAITAGLTEARRSRNEVGLLLRYAAWGLNHERNESVFAAMPAAG